jgi:hypothetical protein
MGMIREVSIVARDEPAEPTLFSHRRGAPLPGGSQSMGQAMSILVVQALMRIRCHPALGSGPAIGSPGYAMPCIDQPRIIAVVEENLPALRDCGIHVEGPVGDGCVIIIDATMPKLDLRCRFGGHPDCAAIVGLGESFAGTVTFAGPHGLFVSAGFGRAVGQAIGQVGAVSRINVMMEASCAAYFGLGVTSADSDWQVEGDDKTPCAVIVGDDAMVSHAVACRNFSGHAMIDIARMAVINAPGHVSLGPHCWLREQARIIGPLSIGAGSIIGVGSVVTGDMPEYVEAAGIPAQIVREGVTWDRRRRPSAEEIKAMFATD